MQCNENELQECDEGTEVGIGPSELFEGESVGAAAAKEKAEGRSPISES